MKLDRRTAPPPSPFTFRDDALERERLLVPELEAFGEAQVAMQTFLRSIFSKRDVDENSHRTLLVRMTRSQRFRHDRLVARIESARATLTRRRAEIEVTIGAQVLARDGGRQMRMATLERLAAAAARSKRSEPGARRNTEAQHNWGRKPLGNLFTWEPGKIPGGDHG